MPVTCFDHARKEPAHRVFTLLPHGENISVTGYGFRAHRRKIRQKHATFLSSVLSGDEE
jgi:hypothetical protein